MVESIFKNELYTSVTCRGETYAEKKVYAQALTLEKI